LEGIGRGLILRHYSGIYLQGLKKITNTLSQDILFPGRDFKPGSRSVNYSTAKFGTVPCKINAGLNLLNYRIMYTFIFLTNCTE
jgi:hypothetical protein